MTGLVDRFIAAMRRTDRTLVVEPWRAKWLILRGVAAMVVFLIAVNVIRYTPNGSLRHTIALIVVSFLAGWQSLQGLRRAAAYQRGHQDGQLFVYQQLLKD